MSNDPSSGLDDIDRNILRILARDPRIPYSDIADELEREGHEMSSEGIRYRVSNLFETVSVLLLTAPKEHGWEVLRVSISVANEPDASAETFEALQELNFWQTAETMGSFDLYAVATVASNREANDLVGRVRGLEHVDEVEYALETARETAVDNYLSV